MEIILVFLALAVGFLAAWFIASRQHANTRQHYEANEKALMATLAETQTQKSVALETVRLKIDEIQRLQLELTKQIEISNTRGMEVAALKVVNENIGEKLENQKSEIETLQKRLTTEFENIATKILKERSDEFSLSNNKHMT